MKKRIWLTRYRSKLNFSKKVFCWFYPEAYLHRHHRAELREGAFYNALQEWRQQKRNRELNKEKQKLVVIDKPRGPWEFALDSDVVTTIQSFFLIYKINRSTVFFVLL